MDAARDLGDFIEENAHDLFGREMVFSRIAARLMPSADLEQHKRAAQIIHSIVVQRRKAIQDREDQKEEQAQEIHREFGTRIWNEIADLTGVPEDNYHYSQAWTLTLTRPKAEPILGASLLMSIVSSFEALVASIVRAQLIARPEVLRASDKSFSYRDLENFSSLDEFRLHLAEEMADGLLRGGLDGWMDWFAKRHKISVPGVTDCPVEFVEIFQRRHLFVHNDGVVNDYYLSKLRALSAPPKDGAKLRVDTDYLRRAIDLLTTAGIKLGVEVARKLFPEAAPDTDKFISNVVYQLLQEGRDYVVAETCEWHLQFATSDSQKIVAMANKWLALKRTRGLESIKDEVESWDTSTLAGRYKLVQLALLGKYEQAHALAQRLRASEELITHEWHTWPVLEEVRTHGRENGLESGGDLYIGQEAAELEAEPKKEGAGARTGDA